MKFIEQADRLIAEIAELKERLLLGYIVYTVLTEGPLSPRLTPQAMHASFSAWINRPPEMRFNDTLQTWEFVI